MAKQYYCFNNLTGELLSATNLTALCTEIYEGNNDPIYCRIYNSYSKKIEKYFQKGYFKRRIDSVDLIERDALREMVEKTDYKGKAKYLMSDKCKQILLERGAIELEFDYTIYISNGIPKELEDQFTFKQVGKSKYIGRKDVLDKLKIEVISGVNHVSEIAS